MTLIVKIYKFYEDRVFRFLGGGLSIFWKTSLKVNFKRGLTITFEVKSS